MNGRKAKQARRALQFFKSVDFRNPALSEKVEHHNVGKHRETIPGGRVDPATGLLQDIVFYSTTSTQVIPARRAYRHMKRLIVEGVL